MNLDPVLTTIVLYMLSTSAAAAVYVVKLVIRVAVLEQAHGSMADLLEEIKMDVKDLVAALHGSESPTRRTKKKP